VHVVALVLQPAEDDRSIETAGISQYAGRHGCRAGVSPAKKIED
jgi:hypothetical protein